MKQEIGRRTYKETGSLPVFLFHIPLELSWKHRVKHQTMVIYGFLFFLFNYLFIYFVLYFYFRILGMECPVSGHAWNVFNWFINIRNIVFLCQGDKFSFISHSLVKETKYSSYMFIKTGMWLKNQIIQIKQDVEGTQKDM